VIATTGTGIVLSSRIVYGMASYRVLPGFLANVSQRYKTPASASIIVGVLLIVLSAVYYLATSVQNAFSNVIDVTGLLFSVFYILTALATMVYYRRRILSGAWDFLILGLLPLGAAGFLGWILVKSLIGATPAELWSCVGILAAGVILMVIARGVFKSPFFQVQRESYAPGGGKHGGSRA
jgi:amino acid transporter